MKLSASTIASPDASWEEIVNTYPEYGYQGLEIRGIKRELYLTKVPEFSDENLAKSLKLAKDNNLEIVSVDAGSSFAGKTGEELEKNIKEAKDHIVLAGKMGAKFIRTFGGEEKGIPIEESIKQVSLALNELGNFAKDHNVIVLMETHGQFCEVKNLAEVINQVSNPNVGIVWDISNSYNVGCGVEETVNLMLNNIKYLHIKDGKDKELTLCGEGDVPIEKAVKLLKERGYSGYWSVEWEKLWHPDIPEDSVALPQYAKKIQEYYA